MVFEAADPERALALPSGSEPLVEITTRDELHIVAAHGTARLRLCVRLARFRPIPALSIPCDKACTLRLAAAARLHRAAQAGRLPADRSALPSANQRRRFVQLLRLHDALEAGTSTHDLAFDLVFPNHRPLTGAVWKGSGEKRHVLRLIATARRLVATGYRGLLLHR